MRSEAGGAGEALSASLALVRRLLLVGPPVRPQVVDRGEALGAAGRGAGEGPQLVVRVQVAPQLVGGGEGPGAAGHRAD